MACRPKSPRQLIQRTELFKCIITMIKDVSHATIRSTSWATTAGQPRDNNKHVLVMISNSGYLLTEQNVQAVKKPSQTKKAGQGREGVRRNRMTKILKTQSGFRWKTEITILGCCSARLAVKETFRVFSNASVPNTKRQPWSYTAVSTSSLSRERPDPFPKKLFSIVFCKEKGQGRSKHR